VKIEYLFYQPFDHIRTPSDDIKHALAIFFPFYVIVEVPSNMMMKRTRPALWIPFIMVCWGVCTTLMGEYISVTKMDSANA
jgi:hypothetical protein